ncbi:hypothetical protein [Microbacterium sp. NPDC057650]|uniref:hypothetical protein n=1 Tax=unclassified Microbacterium TaxID=2609290 RepID=UPI00366C377A
MSEISDALGQIMSEFADAGTRTAALRDAIGHPLDRTSLSSAAHDFESKWDDKRETQRRNLEKMKQHIDDSRNAWKDLDEELAKSLEQSEEPKR